METPKGLWWQAMKGDDDALEQMRLYCDQDVKVLEDVYLYLRPYIKPHPNLGLFIEEDRQCCPSCGHDELEMLNKDYVTFVNSYTAHRCKSCGSVSRARVTNTPIKKQTTINNFNSQIMPAYTVEEWKAITTDYLMEQNAKDQRSTRCAKRHNNFRAN